VLGGATAHSKGAERKSWASLQTHSEVTLRGYTQAESVSDPIARRTAIRKLRHDPTLVVGLNEKMDDFMVNGSTRTTRACGHYVHCLFFWLIICTIEFFMRAFSLHLLYLVCISCLRTHH